MATIVDFPYPVRTWAILPFNSLDLRLTIPSIESIWVLYGRILNFRRMPSLKTAKIDFFA
jgi:hypothetical protein